MKEREGAEEVLAGVGHSDDRQIGKKFWLMEAYREAGL